MIFWLRRRGAVALPKRYRFPIAITENLHLDVPCTRDVFFRNTPPSLKFTVASRVTESYASRRVASSAQIRIPMPPPPAVLLSMTGYPILPYVQLLPPATSSGRSPRHRNPCLLCHGTGRMLKAEQLDMVRCWPDKRDSLLHAGSGKSAFSLRNP